MCMSVPQIAVLRMRMSTSLGPTWGLGASVIQMPGSRFVFARVLMCSSLACRSILGPLAPTEVAMTKSQGIMAALTVLNAAFALVSVSQAQGTGAAPEVVRARMLEIVDAQGRVRASIQVHPANPRVRMPDGSPQEESVVLRLINGDGKPGVKIAASDHNVGLAFVAEQGNYIQVFSDGIKLARGGKQQAAWP